MEKKEVERILKRCKEQLRRRIKAGIAEKGLCFECLIDEDVCAVFPDPVGDRKRVVWACRQHRKLVPRNVID